MIEHWNYNFNHDLLLLKNVIDKLLIKAFLKSLITLKALSCKHMENYNWNQICALCIKVGHNIHLMGLGWDHLHKSILHYWFLYVMKVNTTDNNTICIDFHNIRMSICSEILIFCKWSSCPIICVSKCHYHVFYWIYIILSKLCKFAPKSSVSLGY